MTTPTDRVTQLFEALEEHPDGGWVTPGGNQATTPPQPRDRTNQYSHGEANQIPCQRPNCNNTLTGQKRKWCSPRCARWGQNANNRRLIKEILKREAERTYLWQPDEQAAHQAAHDLKPAIHEWRDNLEDPDNPTPLNNQQLDAIVTELADRFVEFRDEYFQTPEGKTKRNPSGRYYTKPFHHQWVKLIIKTWLTGGRAMILAPPRHGKSELLAHFVVWLICHEPNIRIMWVCANREVAELTVSTVKNILESNTRLIERYCRPDTGFKPGRNSGQTWSAFTFEVATRDPERFLKAPTLVAMGWQGRILSRDCDIIILDDIEDDKSTATEGARTATRHKMEVTLESRKEEHTPLFMIGSRQHIDDIYGYNLTDDEWKTIVERAHSLTCDKNPHNTAIHGPSCMLFPEIRTYRWYWKKHQTAKNKGLSHLFNMVYNNVVRLDGLQIFQPEHVTQCRNPQRPIGKQGLNDWPHHHLVAGIDPAITQYQAAVLWAINSETRRIALIDISNQQGGGLGAVADLIEHWHDTYRVKHYVIETNLFGADFGERINTYTNRHNIYIEPHHTGGQKWDPIFGVTGMADWFENQRIDIPWHNDDTTRDTIAMYETQLLNFTQRNEQSRRANRNKADIVLASWFPWATIRRLTGADQVKTVERTPDNVYDWLNNDLDAMWAAEESIAW